MDSVTSKGMLELLQDFSIMKYTGIAFLTLLLYDHALTFDLEVSRIWTLPWRIPKVLFLINRYLIPPMLLFDGLSEIHSLYANMALKSLQRLQWTKGNLCNFTAKWTVLPTILSLGTVELMLILRVSAIYSHNKQVIRFLIGLFILELGGWLTIGVLITIKTTSLPGDGLFTGCLYSAPSYFFAAWVPPVVFETVIISLTAYKIFKYGHMVPTLHILARDSIAYFSVIFLILIANVFLSRFGKALLIIPCSVIACIAAARMTMNIRELSTEKYGCTIDHEIQCFSVGEKLGT